MQKKKDVESWTPGQVLLEKVLRIKTVQSHCKHVLRGPLDIMMGSAVCTVAWAGTVPHTEKKHIQLKENAWSSHARECIRLIGM